MNFLNLIQGAAGKVKGVATLLSGLTKTQAIIAGVATVTAVGGVGTGGYFLYDHFHQPEPIVADVVISTEVAEEPTEEVVAVEEVVTEETEAAEPETVTLVGSSIEKDLKIKIQDESSKNVRDSLLRSRSRQTRRRQNQLHIQMMIKMVLFTLKVLMPENMMSL